MELPKKKKPTVKKMESKDFLNFSKQMNFVNLSRPIAANGEKFTWLQIQKFKFEKGLFGFKFRYDIDEDYRTCLLGPKRIPKNQNLKILLYVLHPEGVNLKPAKVADLQLLM